MHEAELHNGRNSFVTLTYNDENLPLYSSLSLTDHQNFMKDLRTEIYPQKVRFFMCGEYGKDENQYNQIGRPHYHYLLFGYDFPDKRQHRESKGNILYRSPLLESIWKKGFSEIGSVSVQSAAYVARYVLKKRTGKGKLDHYQRVDFTSGETHTIKPEFNLQSLKPGLAKNWYDKYKSDIFPEDECILDGRRFKTPKYYDDQLEKECPEDYWIVKTKRRSRAMENLEENLPKRLETRHLCELARSKQKQREMENET